MASWFGNMFHQVKLYFADSTWLVEENISDRTMKHFRPYQATAVYRCSRVDPTSGEEAIVKIHMQIPHGRGLSAEKLAQQASTAVNIIVKTEIDFLSHLTRHGCSSTPRLLSYCQIQQTEKMCLPGGYIVFMLMEKLPGKMIMDFWDYDRETRDRIRAGFKSGWMEMNNACVRHNDAGLRNILWDENTGKCYIIDFEDAEFIDKPSPWPRYEFFFWELVKDSEEGEDNVL